MKCPIPYSSTTGYPCGASCTGMRAACARRQGTHVADTMVKVLLLLGLRFSAAETTPHVSRKIRDTVDADLAQSAGGYSTSLASLPLHRELDTTCSCHNLCTCDGLSELMHCLKPCTGSDGTTTLFKSCNSFKSQCATSDLTIECTDTGDGVQYTCKKPLCKCQSACTCDGLIEYMDCMKPCTGSDGTTTLLQSCNSVKSQCASDLSIECTDTGDAIHRTCSATAAAKTAIVRAVIWSAWYMWIVYTSLVVLVIRLVRKCLRNICSDGGSETRALNEATNHPRPPIHLPDRAPTATMTELNDAASQARALQNVSPPPHQVMVGTPVQEQSAPDAPHDEIVSKLAALKKLHDVGTISKEDFENKKVELLGRM